MFVEDISLKELSKLRRERYNRTKFMECPFLHEVVHFNKIGFFHTTHDGREKIRGEADARMRLHLLPWIYRVVKKSRHYGEPPRVVSKADPNNSTGEEVVFYEICYRFKGFDGKKVVSVILRRVGNGNLHYYSVRYTKKQNRPDEGSA
jgi:hypothetical protein